MNDVLTDYVRRTLHWNPSDYRIENRGVTADGRSEIIAVIHRSDEFNPLPGAGLSIVLYVNRVSLEIEMEAGYQ